MSVAADTLTVACRWQRYPLYKGAQLSYLDSVPNHWDVYPLRRLLKPGNDGIKIGPFGSQLKLEIMQDSGFKVYGQEHVIRGDFETGSKYISESKFRNLKACALRPGDLVVSMMGTTGRCRVVPRGVAPGLMDSHLLRIRVREEELLPSFVALVIDEADYIRGQIDMAGKGAIMQGLNSSLIKNLNLALPPRQEQLSILEFLARETAKIDALIAKKEQLIELLQEKRAALISQAVTKGLDPSVPMKDSGIEWLENIPTHWECNRLKYTVRGGLVNGLFKKRDQFGSGIKLVNVFDIYQPTFLVNPDQLDRVAAVPSEMNTFAIEAGDILFVRSSLKLEGVAASALVPEVSEPTVFECHLVRIRPVLRRAVPKYLIYYLNSSIARQRLVALAETTTMTTIAQPKLSSLAVLLPPTQEQKQVVALLDVETAKIDRLIAKVRAAIDKLNEYRAALISAAVTGKIDVREAPA
jgi:type I restriction enzyme, S subunit